MTNDTQTTPTTGATHALREVVEDIQSRDTLLSVHRSEEHTSNSSHP